MNFKKILAGVMTGTMVVAMGVPALAEDTEYRAYLAFQTSSYSFRNTWDEESYGLAGTANTDEIDYSVVHAWDGSDLVSASGTFTDVVITGDGTYTVSVTGLDWPDDEYYREIGVSTDIPWDTTATITVDKVVIGSTEFDNPEVFNDGIDGTNDYTYLKVDSEYSGVSLGTYDALSSNIEITFTISGLEAGVGDAAALAGDTAPVVYLGAIVAVAGLAMVVTKKKELA